MKRGLLCLVVLGTSACSTTAAPQPGSSTSTSTSTSSGLNGQITATDATCTQFAAGSSTTLAHLHFRTKGAAISVVLPQSFSYWVRVSAPGKAKSFVVNQSVAPSGELFLATGGAAYTNAGGTCTALTNTVSQNPDSAGKTTVTYSSVAPVSELYFMVEFSTVSLIGRPPPAAGHSPVYKFTTSSVNGSEADADLTQTK